MSKKKVGCIVLFVIAVVVIGGYSGLQRLIDDYIVPPWVEQFAESIGIVESTPTPRSKLWATTEAGRKETPIPGATPSLEQELEAAIEGNKPAHEGAFEWEYHPPDYGLGARIDVVYFFDQILTDKLALKDFVRSFLSTAPELYGLDQSLDVLNVRYETTFVDTYGKESKGWMLKIQILRETADKINWGNMLMCDVPRVVEVFTPHPSLTAVWNEVCP